MLFYVFNLKNYLELFAIEILRITRYRNPYKIKLKVRFELVFLSIDSIVTSKLSLSTSKRY